MKKRLLLLIIIILLLAPVIFYISKGSAEPEVPNLESVMYAAEGDGTLYFVNWAWNIESFRDEKVKLVDNNSSACYPCYEEGTLFFLNRSTREYISISPDGTRRVLYTFETPVSCLFKDGDSLYAAAYPPFSFMRINLADKTFETLAALSLEPKYTAVSKGSAYWVDDEVIYRMDLDGGQPEKLISGYANNLVAVKNTLYYNYRIDDVSANPLNQIVSYDLTTGKAKTVLEPPKGEIVRLIGAAGDKLIYYITSGFMSVDIYSYKDGKSSIIYGGFKYEPAVYNDNICLTENYLLFQTINENPNAIELTDKWHDSPHTRLYNYVISLKDGTLYLLDVSNIIMGFD
jgi:hypothetical protein